MRGEGADRGEVAVATVVVQAVADDELVRDVEADVRHVDRVLGASGLRKAVMIFRLAGLRDIRLLIRYDRVRPVSMMSSTTSTCMPVMSVFRSLRIRTTPEDWVPEPYEEIGHPVHPAVALQRPREVGHHHHGAVEDADQEQLLALVVAVDLGGELDDPIAATALWC